MPLYRGYFGDFLSNLQGVNSGNTCVQARQRLGYKYNNDMETVILIEIKKLSTFDASREYYDMISTIVL